jgi:hypothetical protein
MAETIENASDRPVIDGDFRRDPLGQEIYQVERKFGLVQAL